MAEVVIETRGLTKVYRGEVGKKGFKALDRLDLAVHRGEVYAFIGPNGAGKTTTIKLLTRLLFPTSGTIRIGGEPLGPEALRKVGYLPEQPSIYGYLTGIEFLDFIGRLFGLDRITRQRRITELLALVGLEGRGNDLIRGYSRGMLQRLGLAQALMNDPEILILDEPVSNLDPIGRREVRDVIFRLKENGKTLFFSSHILQDAEMIADRVGILHQGRLIQEGSLEVLTTGETGEVEITFELHSDLLPPLGFDPNDLIRQGNRLILPTCPADRVGPILRAIDQSGGRILSVIPRRRSLEDVFMSRIGR